MRFSALIRFASPSPSSRASILFSAWATGVAWAGFVGGAGAAPATASCSSMASWSGSSSSLTSSLDFSVLLLRSPEFRWLIGWWWCCRNFKCGRRLQSEPVPPAFSLASSRRCLATRWFQRLTQALAKLKYNEELGNIYTIYQFLTFWI